MIVQAIQDSGGRIVVAEESVELDSGASLAAFEAFRACLKISAIQFLT